MAAVGALLAYTGYFRRLKNVECNSKLGAPLFEEIGTDIRRWYNG
jgi:hypothetical protein